MQWWSTTTLAGFIPSTVQLSNQRSRELNFHTPRHDTSSEYMSTRPRDLHVSLILGQLPKIAGNLLVQDATC